MNNGAQPSQVTVGQIQLLLTAQELILEAEKPRHQGCQSDPGCVP